MVAQVTFTQYLAAKKSIDDRSLNAGVWARLADILPQGTESHPLQVLELGSGIGTMVERCLERGLLRQAIYTAVDQDAQLVEIAQRRLSRWPTAQVNTAEPDSWSAISLPGQNDAAVKINLIVNEALDFVHARRGRTVWDLIIAHAFLDLVDLEFIPVLLELLEPQGLFYFSLNFDGLTAFLPEIDRVFDQIVIDLYHRSMDERRVNGALTGGSCTGRRLLEKLLAVGAHILQAGASDWVITPHAGRYTPDEVTFLQAIVQTVQDELQDHPQLDRQQFKEWIEKRQAQIERGELVYIAHQIDLVGQPKG
jgi:SAM-dependent methyltransferase